MTDQRRVQISKYLSRYLRHTPAELGLILEPGGWVLMVDFLDATRKSRFVISSEELLEVVVKCDKQRFGFDETGTKIRANQGHSTPVDLQLEPVAPPDRLYHGTSFSSLPSILKSGLNKMSRQQVHLSEEIQTARKVGARHGKPVVLVLDTFTMLTDGILFYKAENGVWLTDHVPPRYLRLLEPDTE